METKPEYVQLETNEDVISVRDRLSFIRGRRVLLIWPETGTALTRKLDLVLVQREAKRRVLQLALVTHDPGVIEHARDLGISTFETIGESERNRWKRGRTRVFLPRQHKPSHNPDPEELMSVASRVRRPRKRISLLRYLLTRIIVLTIVLGVIGGSAYLILPYAEVQITPERELIAVETQIMVDPLATDIDIDNGVIPATRLTATVQTVSSVPTSGLEQLDDTRSIGIVTFTNQTLQRIEIEAGTIVSTSAGTPIQFRTTLPATVRGGVGERVEVAIEALPAFAGAIGNVEIGMINTVEGALADDLTVRNVSATTGGESRNRAVVTAEDRERLLGITRGQLQALAYDEMQLQLSETQLIVLETIRIAEERDDWTTFSHDTGSVTDTLTLDMRAIVEAFVIDDRFAQRIVFARLSAAKPPSLILQPDSFLYERGSVSVGEAVMLSASGTAQVSAQIDAALLQEQLAGQDLASVENTIRAYVNLAAGTQPVITVYPEWLPTMPQLPVRIFINSGVVAP